MRKKKSSGYLATVGKVAPAFAAKALVGDIPKGAVEELVERRLQGHKTGVGALKRALKGRAAGRAAGGITGILTAPLYLKGIDLLGSKKKGDKLRGAALLTGATGVYGVQKGSFEGFGKARAAGMTKTKSLASGLSLGLARASHKVPAAMIMGLALAKAQKNKAKAKKKGGLSHHALPALTGAAVTGGARGYESVVQDVLRNKQTMAKALRRALPAIGGGTVGGLLGGLVLSGAVDVAKKAMKK